MTLSEAKQLKTEAGQLFETLSKMFRNCAMPQVKADYFTDGDTQAQRLGRLSNKAYQRVERRREIVARIKWAR